MKTKIKPIVKNLMAVIATTALAHGAANAGAVFQLDTSAIVGSTTAHTFLTDEMTFTAVGLPKVTVTDTNNDGLLGGADDFLEVGVQSIVNFQLGNVNVPGLTSGVNVFYDMIADFTFNGVSGFVGPNNVATFTSGTVDIFYDEIVNGVKDGGAALIAGLNFAVANGSQCVITGPGLAEGSCGLTLDFDHGVADPGVWTIGGVDLGTLLATIEINVDVDDITPPFSVAYAGYGVTCGAGSGGALCMQMVNLDQDGSGVINVNAVPEPGTLALLGISVLGLASGARRRKA